MKQVGEKVGPRIYNLFPTLAGPVDRWTAHASRAAAMGFNWLFLNPVHLTGKSGSLYSIKNFQRFSSELFDDEEKAGSNLAAFIADARSLGLRVMIDLVINHSAIDADLLETHPHWYRRDEFGDPYRPRVADPNDQACMTIWHDLAEFDYESARVQTEMVAYWRDYLRRLTALGIEGFRCDAAYKIPAIVWHLLIEQTKKDVPKARFFAETLGCTPQQLTALKDCGFDYFFNSSKWWDFRSSWLLDQYENNRRIAPSISFPESHDTDRIGTASNDGARIAREARFHYLFAACFSSGVLMPIGYEFGFRRRLHVVHTKPSDWEPPTTDIGDFIAAVNALKAGLPVLNEEGPQRIVTALDGQVVGLFRENTERTEAALMLINPDKRAAHGIDGGQLIAAAGGHYQTFIDVTPQSSPLALTPGTAITLEPFEMHIFHVRAEIGSVSLRDDEDTGLNPISLSRIAIENAMPTIGGGRFPIKRIVGDVLEVTADIFCDGHDKLGAHVRLMEDGMIKDIVVPMRHIGNDRWTASLPVGRRGRYTYIIEAWRDLFGSWRDEVAKKLAAGRNVTLELEEGRNLVDQAGRAANGPDEDALGVVLSAFDQSEDESRCAILLDESLAFLMSRVGPRADLSQIESPVELVVDRPAARFGAWYELFPRSLSDNASRHGTFDDVIRHLPYIQHLGFDVLYMPPIHPIGVTNRKGRNNGITANPGDPGSPYAIGSHEGDHTAIHPALGTMADFRRLVRVARQHGLEIALDFAIQCSLDHPWIKEHPEWFDWRSDGTLKFAENPPKRYEDIVNVQFYGDAYPAVWQALRDVVLFWVGEGVRLFRVDNPHTKPLPFWEWLIRDVRDRHSDVIFLAEAFTRPAMMCRLAKIGFSQSYSYFTWRNTKHELMEYLTELTQSPMREYYQPNFFVNTPDINPLFLQTSGRAGFQIRAVLAATLSSVWGMYSGFELCEATPLPGKEEYMDSEKYELRAWDWDRPGNIRDDITRLNRIRRENPALREFANLKFFAAHNNAILFYGKMTAGLDNIVWIAVSLDPHHVVEGHLVLPLNEAKFPPDRLFEVEDLMTGRREMWRGNDYYLRLAPDNPYRIWRVRANP